MTKKTEWSHLPNAGHIDRVLASVKAHPEAWNEARLEAWYAAWYAAGYAAGYAARDAAWDQARDAASSEAWRAVRDAIIALIAWDDCARYLDMSSDQLKVWAILSEKPACILLLPAVIVFEKIAELEMV